MQSYQDIKQQVCHFIAKVAGWLETVLAGVVMIALVISCVPVLKEVTTLWGGSTESFHAFLSNVLMLVIGIEFIEMLVKHNPGSTLEVLLFAIVRHMLVGHGSSLENLLSVLAVGVIFLIRKFAFSESFGEEIAAPDSTIPQAPPKDPEK